MVKRYIVTKKFGFRTVEVRDRDGIMLMERIMFRGVCRHSFWPTTGRALNKSISIEDVQLMKDMNMNAVRMSHYPPDAHFLDVCDSLGLFVLDELSGWSVPPYDTLIGKKLVKEMVTRDVNHPCIVLWDNGNEGGWNNALNGEFAKYDPQKRKVIHPWALFNGMDTQHYREWNYGQDVFFNGRDIFFPTEFLHGLYDGGLGAGLDDYWNLMLDRRLSAGGFLWDFSDEGVVRTDMDGWIDTREIRLLTASLVLTGKRKPAIIPSARSGVPFTLTFKTFRLLSMVNSLWKTGIFTLTSASASSPSASLVPPVLVRRKPTPPSISLHPRSPRA